MLYLLLLLFTVGGWAAPSSELKQALGHYESRDFESARHAAESVLLSGRGDEIEAALYLIVRVNLATGQADRAQRGAERLLDAFPDGRYGQFARFALAESSFLLDGMAAAREHLQWCADSATDRKLTSRAREILAEQSSFDAEEYLFPGADGEVSHDLLGSEHRANVWLLLSFPNYDDSAPEDLQSAFTFAAEQLDAFDVTVERVSSALGAVKVLDRAVADACDVIVFAGDEGSATSLALANGDHEFPILKLTSTPQALAPLAPGIVEMLASQEAQAVQAARFAAMDLNIDHGLLMTPRDDDGAAHRIGFERAGEFGLKIDAEIEYPANASSVRRELYDLMSAPARLERGAEVSQAVLSREAREKLFGESGGGDVSVTALPPSSGVAEVFFFSLEGDRIGNYCSQMGQVPQGMTLFGNSSWLDERALSAQPEVTRNMYVVAPLLPVADRHTELFRALDDREEFDLSPWQLLAVDAADFLSAILRSQASAGTNFVEAARSLGKFSGCAVEVDIAPTGENRTARILQFDGEALKVVK